jgi:transcriptional regulator with XRE-family HTH domain
MKKEGNIITSWLNQNRNPEIDKFIEKNLAITEKVRLAMELKGWKSQDLAKEMGKKPSEVSKWLTGMQNLTLKSIIKMELALGVELININPSNEYQYVFLGDIETKNRVAEKVNSYQKLSKTKMVLLAI